MTLTSNPSGKGAGSAKDYSFLYFSLLVDRPVRTPDGRKLGQLTDLVFRLVEPYPLAMGIYLEHGWGKPTELIPWERVVRIESKAVIVQAPDGAEQYPPFKDQPGWILLNDHLMGKTILDMDGRKIEVVNDVHLLESQGKMLIAHVDISFNGFLRRWHLGRFHWLKDQFISWRYVQPLSTEDAVATDRVSLSITRGQIRELPSEDLADALEELSGAEQQAVFSVLDSEKAADTLMEAEPRAQRQIIANLRQERAKAILGEMSVMQLADLLTVLPHDDKRDLLALLPSDQAERIAAILSEHEAQARTIMSESYVAMTKETRVGEAMRTLRTNAKHDTDVISYIYIINTPDGFLQGVVDLRDLVLANDDATLGDLMAAPVVSVEESDLKEEIGELFAKYHFRMLPVVDAKDRMLGVIHYNDIMKGLVMRAKI